MFEKCQITKYLCAFCGEGYCGIGIKIKDKLTKKCRIENRIEFMGVCPKEREEKK